MPEGDEVAEPREVFWAEAKQSPEQKEGRGDESDESSRRENGGANKERSRRAEGANQPYARASPVFASDFDSDEVLSRLVGHKCSCEAFFLFAMM